jgi:Ni,Fe-hydrogenase III small subunit/ferredoxin-like protein FixX
MLDLLKLRIKHGYQAISDIRNAPILETHRGFPVIDQSKYSGDWQQIVDACPAKAIINNPFSIDLGKCIFCGECEKLTNGAIRFTNEYKLGNTSRVRLIVKAGMQFHEYITDAIEARKEIHKIFGRSIKLRQVSAAGCNGCELELNASGNVNFDMGRFGIDFVASPRHADGIVITGPISKNMAPALKDTYESISDPKIVIAFGACAISGGIFAESEELNRSFLDEVKVDLYIPGSPPHPLTFINAVLDFIGRK